MLNTLGCGLDIGLGWYDYLEKTRTPIWLCANFFKLRNIFITHFSYDGSASGSAKFEAGTTSVVFPEVVSFVSTDINEPGGDT